MVAMIALKGTHAKHVIGKQQARAKDTFLFLEKKIRNITPHLLLRLHRPH
jgi:hypothetical protein